MKAHAGDRLWPDGDESRAGLIIGVPDEDGNRRTWSGGPTAMSRWYSPAPTPASCQGKRAAMAGMLASALGLYLTTDVTYEGQHMTLGELLMQEVGKAWGGTSDNPLIVVLARLRQLQRKGVIPKTSMDLSAV